MKKIVLYMIVASISLCVYSCKSDNNIIGYWYGESEDGTYYATRFEKNNTCYSGRGLKSLDDIDNKLNKKEYYQVSGNSVTIDESQPVGGMPSLLIEEREGKTVLYPYFLDSASEMFTDAEYTEWYRKNLAELKYMVGFNPKQMNNAARASAGAKKSNTEVGGKKNRALKGNANGWAKLFDESGFLFFDTGLVMDNGHLYMCYHPYGFSDEKTDGTMTIIRKSYSGIRPVYRCAYKYKDNTVYMYDCKKRDEGNWINCFVAQMDMGFDVGNSCLKGKLIYDRRKDTYDITAKKMDFDHKAYGSEKNDGYFY